MYDQYMSFSLRSYLRLLILVVIQVVCDRRCRTQVSGWAALHISAWNGHVELMQLLLESGQCEVDFPGPGSVTSVFLAAQQRHCHAIELLISAGCDVTRRATLRMSDSGGHVASHVTALHLAAQAGHVEAVRQLLAAGALVDAAMTAGHLASVTPLHLAVEAGHSDVINLLIEAGCNVNRRTRTSPPHEDLTTRVVN